ncbi:hypothetical protein PIB30_059025 [Stylosanthes scabra]|uniref:Ubiquitin-like protease family profile domain-containing protein n=1 Tax=Stylosanthes scabra TaxID=79078 RepID=A0ABU6SK43_9FABA|nr:hypothetical protein [Stylosanthes scabra]
MVSCGLQIVLSPHFRQRIICRGNSSTNSGKTHPLQRKWPRIRNLMLVYGPNTPGFVDGGDFPSCINVYFRPPHGVRFRIMELVLVGYIFSRRKQKSEVLVADDHARGDRRTLLSLHPGKDVEDDASGGTNFLHVINVLARNLTVCHEDKCIWWLPTTFAQFALNPTNHCAITFEYIKRVYMGKADELRKIFVPLNLDHHWYLMIIDILVDSMGSSTSSQSLTI